jgi:urea transport system ATP-binding protein
MSAPVLELSQITVSFDGFLALRDLNLSLQPGELRAVIGPNGAGKTTFLDVITGKTAPTEGDVVFKGRSLVGRAEHRIARLGIGRKFQSPRVFEKLSVQENLALAVSRPKQPWPRQPAEPCGLAGRGAFPWPEAMAGDRDAGGTGPRSAAGG